MSQTATLHELHDLNTSGHISATGSHTRSFDAREPILNSCEVDVSSCEEYVEVLVQLKKGRAAIVVAQLTAVTFLTSVSTGLITVSIPKMASDLNLATQLYYW